MGTDSDKMVPPYDGRSRSASDSESGRELRRTIDDQLEQTHGPGKPGATTSPVDESPVDADEVSNDRPDSPLGVGVSTTRRGEDVKKQEGTEPGRRDLGTRGKSGRPSGTTDPRDSTGVDPEGSGLTDRDMPNTGGSGNG